MSFRLEPEAPIASEIRRLVLAQLEAAISELRAVGDPESDEAIHDARRRVKKIRAVIRLVRPALDKTYRAVDRELKNVSRMLAPVADGQGNRIEYTLDQSGNRTAEQAKDPQGTLKRTMSRVFDALGRAQQTTGRE